MYNVASTKQVTFYYTHCTLKVVVDSEQLSFVLSLVVHGALKRKASILRTLKNVNLQLPI